MEKQNDNKMKRFSKAKKKAIPIDEYNLKTMDTSFLKEIKDDIIKARYSDLDIFLSVARQEASAVQKFFKQ